MGAAAENTLTLEDIEKGNIDAAQFNHRAHVHAAWLLLDRYPLPQAIVHFSDILARLTEALGASDKYHETVTWFFLFVIHERRCRASQPDWDAFERDNPDLFDARAMLARYYSQERLNSDIARRTFLLPNRPAS